MKLTVIGCAGSYPGPDSPASCYLVESTGSTGPFRLVLDLGNGSLGALQRVIDLNMIDAIAISHLHPDHCADISGLYVVCKYHPSGAAPRIPIYAPEGAAQRFAEAYGSDADGLKDQFEFHSWAHGEVTQIGPFEVSTIEVVHPVPAYAIKISDGTHNIVYSGDTGPTEALVDFAFGADLFLCETSFVESAENPPELHLTGAEAGEYAKRAGVGKMLATHIPAWIDRAEVERDIVSRFDGPHRLVEAGDIFQL